MSKADGLLRLQQLGLPVPPFQTVRADSSPDAILAAYDAVAGPAGVAVRSSAEGEDASGASYAGQFASFLAVTRGDVVSRVREVHDSYASAGAGAYGSRVGGQATDGPVVVQRMAEATLSGVVFSADPAGVLDDVVITLGSGAGAVVAGDGPTTTAHVCVVDGQGYETGDGPAIPASLREQLVALARRAQEGFGHPVDLEVAVDAEGTVWVLQARPITTLPDGSTTTLDASNIVESYPGLSLPLTASFVPRAYAGVFISLARRLAPRVADCDDVRAVLDHMAAASSGRLYYRIDHWYQVFTLMPLSGVYTRIWQDALGVTDRSYGPAPLLPAWRKPMVVVKLLRALAATPRLLAGLHDEVESLRGSVRPEAAATLAELRAAYADVERRALAHWDVTLLNDVHAFVYPALLSGWLRLTGRGDANALISGIAGIESLRPVHAMQRLAALEPDLSDVHDDASARRLLARDDELGRQLRAYVDEFGDRYLEELKLESPTFRTHPLLLVEALRRADETGAATSAAATATRGSGVRQPGEDDDASGPSTPPATWRGRLTGRLVKDTAGPSALGRGRFSRRLVERATAAIARREASRLDRARVYGLVRAIALRAGELHAAAGHLEAAEGVWWLTLDELFEGTDHREAVGQRRADYEGFARLPAYRRRIFAGEPFDVHPSPDARPLGEAARAATPGTRDTERRATGVSGGTATGPVRVVHDPREPFTPGDVLVARTTDPGWVFLLMAAGAVVVERGSLLSHTAIIARELGVPVVVGVPDATGWLHDGDLVSVDGDRGAVRLA